MDNDAPEVFNGTNAVSLAWQQYCGEKDLPIDDAFVFAAGFAAAAASAPQQHAQAALSDERADFEKHFREQGFDMLTETDKNGEHYALNSVRAYWIGWSARAILATRQPAPTEQQLQTMCQSSFDAGKAYGELDRAAPVASAPAVAVPPDAAPIAITDSSALNGIKWYVPPPEHLRDGMNLYLVTPKMVAPQPAAAPVAADVAQGEAWKATPLHGGGCAIHTENPVRVIAEVDCSSAQKIVAAHNEAAQPRADAAPVNARKETITLPDGKTQEIYINDNWQGCTANEFFARSRSFFGFAQPSTAQADAPVAVQLHPGVINYQWPAQQAVMPNGIVVATMNDSVDYDASFPPDGDHSGVAKMIREGRDMPAVDQAAAAWRAAIQPDSERDAALAGIPDGWAFSGADFSIIAGGGRKPGNVTLVRTGDDRKNWHVFADADVVPLYVWGRGATFNEALKDAISEASAAPPVPTSSMAARQGEKGPA